MEASVGRLEKTLLEASGMATHLISLLGDIGIFNNAKSTVDIGA